MVDYDDLPLSHSYSWNWTWRCGLGPKSPDWDDRYANWNSEGCGVLRGVQQDLAAESPAPAQVRPCSIHASCVWHAPYGS